MNVGKYHWFYCPEHRVRWCVGYNLQSSWRYETEEDWNRNWQKLQDYTDIGTASQLGESERLERWYRLSEKGGA